MFVNKKNPKIIITTNVCAAFCGTGKTYLCNKFADKYMEFECWKYTTGDFPTNYINDIKSKIKKIKYIFISTNPVVLKKLYKQKIEVNLFYPDNNLKNEYLLRFAKRGSSSDFIKTLDEYWDTWLNELNKQCYCKQTVLKSGEYLQNVILN